MSLTGDPLPAGLSLETFWLDDDRDIALEVARASLAPEEQARAARFKFDRDRTRYIRGRGFLRRCLGARLGLEAAAVPLAEGPHKKPELTCPGPGFNLSHSQAQAVLALHPGGPVGVDIEQADRAIDPLALARGCFLEAEIAVLAALPEGDLRRARFFTFWTAKEALMKLTGEGLYLDPKSIALDLQDGLPTGFLHPTTARAVQLVRPDMGPGLHLALAFE